MGKRIFKLWVIWKFSSFSQHLVESRAWGMIAQRTIGGSQVTNCNKLNVMSWMYFHGKPIEECLKMMKCSMFGLSLLIISVGITRLLDPVACYVSVLPGWFLSQLSYPRICHTFPQQPHSPQLIIYSPYDANTYISSLDRSPCSTQNSASFA